MTIVCMSSGWRLTLRVRGCGSATCRPNHIRGSPSIPCCSSRYCRAPRTLTYSKHSEAWWDPVTQETIQLTGLNFPPSWFSVSLSWSSAVIQHQQFFGEHQWLPEAQGRRARSLYFCSKGGWIWSRRNKWGNWQGDPFFFQHLCVLMQ